MVVHSDDWMSVNYVATTKGAGQTQTNGMHQGTLIGAIDFEVQVSSSFQILFLLFYLYICTRFFGKCILDNVASVCFFRYSILMFTFTLTCEKREKRKSFVFERGWYGTGTGYGIPLQIQEDKANNRCCKRLVSLSNTRLLGWRKAIRNT